MASSNGITFFEEYFEYMDDMTPEQFCEFMTLIRNLRFKYIDTKPEDIEDKDVRMAWRCVRPVVLKSRTNADDYKAKKAKASEANKPTVVEQQEVDDSFNPDFGNPISISDDGFNNDLEKAKRLYENGDWWFDHHINDMKNKYHMEYDEIKSMIES